MTAVTKLLGRMLQETGQRLQLLGASAMKMDHFRDHFSRHRKTLPTNGRQPAVDSSAWIASTAVVAGDVTLGQRSSVWYVQCDIYIFGRLRVCMYV
eukprot:534687_1